MNHRLLALALLLLVAACSNTPTKEAAPEKVQSATTPSQQTQETVTAANRPAAVAGTPDPLKDPSNILSRRSFYFDYDQSEIKSTDTALLQAHANYLRLHPGIKVVVQGNTDERGSREYNIALGQRRAEEVKRYLKLQGAGEIQIDTVSFGKEKPRCALSEESCWSQNRRADIAYPGE